MRRRAVPPIVLVPLLIVAIVISTSACGTMANFNGGRIYPVDSPATVEPERPPIAYGGVLWGLKRGLKSQLPLSEKAIFFPLWLVDIGLSAGLDTLTLPIVIWINAKLAYQRMIGEYPTAPDPVLGLPPADESLPPPIRDIKEPTAAEKALTPQSK